MSDRKEKSKMVVAEASASQSQLKASTTPYNPQNFSSSSKGPSNRLSTNNTVVPKNLPPPPPPPPPESSKISESKPVISSSVASVWGKAPSEAVRTAPPPPSAANAIASQQQRPLSGSTTNQTINTTKQKPLEHGKQVQQHSKNKSSYHHNNDQYSKTRQRSSIVGENVIGIGHSYHSGDARTVQQTFENRQNETKVPPEQKQGHSHQNNNQRNNRPNDHRQTQKISSEQKGSDIDWKRGKSITYDFFLPGDGVSASQRAVTRIHVEDLLALRLSLLDLPSGLIIPASCIWNSPTRKEEIFLIHNTPRHVGDVSAMGKKKSKKEPELVMIEPPEDCKPLEVNDETRWKAKVFEAITEKASAEAVNYEPDTDEAVLKKALLILNKLSLTKFDKLSNDFLACGIGRNEKCLRGAIQLIVKKAQDEQHFSAMYASLCLKLAATPMALDEGDYGKKGKKFKKMLLEECQKEFEQDAATKVNLATQGIEDNEEKRIITDLVKKNYLGHMRFIGELYKGDIINIKVMIFCLRDLLESDGKLVGSEERREDAAKNDVDEEKIECFSKLMATIGFSLEQQSDALKSTGKFDTSEKLEECWDRVAVLSGIGSGHCPNVSTRIKFLLQDLIELKNNRWVARRREESAKTIAEIHMEVEEEKKQLPASLQRSASEGLKRQSSYGVFERPKPIIDADGFVEVQKAPFGRSRSMINIPTTSVTASMATMKPYSILSKHSAKDLIKLSQDTKLRINDKKFVLEDVIIPSSAEANDLQKPIYEYASRAKTIFKDFFRSGDVHDVMMSFEELLKGAEDSSTRRVKITEISIMTVLEMRHNDVLKLLQFISCCYQERKLDSMSLMAALRHPFEVLQDLSIDAPLAGRHMVTIVSELIRIEAISLDSLLNIPESFRMDGGAATFVCDVVKTLGVGNVDSKAFDEIIEKLMTDEDVEKFSSSQAMISALAEN